MTDGAAPMRRIEDARVTHLEIWDAVVGGGSLFAQRERDDYPSLVADVAAREARARGVATVYLGGGDSRLAAVERELRRRGVRTLVAADPVFVAEIGARAWIGTALAPLIVDAGQTSFKVVGPAGRLRVAREASWTGEVGFVAALQRVVADAGEHDAAAVGLPCQLEGRFGLSSSYFDRLDLNAIERLFEVPLWIASDAELAAQSALTEHGSEPTLVLTLGHGVGAAVVRP